VAPPVTGFDGDAEAVEAARENVARAGLTDLVTVERRQVAHWLPPPATDGTDQPGPAGLLVVNPPYGRRLGEVDELTSLYTAIGDRLKSHFGGWRAAVLSGDGRLSRALRLKSSRRHALRNGPIDCRLLVYPIAARRREPAATPTEPSAANGPTSPAAAAPSPGAAMFANRLRKNLRKMRRWARRNDVWCYRIYDADIPEYNVAIDLYERWAHVSEYAPPPSVDAAAAARRREEALAVTAEVLEIEPEGVFYKVRRRQRGTAQYQRRGDSGRELSVREGGHRFLVNLSDYIDTGLFLDHRLTRAMLAELAVGRDVLNLFAYTATGTVYAALAGARSTTSVDLSRTYLAWAQRNLTLNGVSGDAHRLVRADCLAWLSQHRGRYGLIFLDPPTFSTSKAMRGTLDIQRDHVDLLERTAALLEPDGVLIFSNNFSQFEMAAEALPELEVEDVTAATIPFDFRRTPRIHNTWRIRHRQHQGTR
jgi:23S rRNA (guanine2445-N2)-methyltransferase / 23S rRNA (guanine2069-N7)-methyltransferase